MILEMFKDPVQGQEKTIFVSLRCLPSPCSHRVKKKINFEKNIIPLDYSVFIGIMSSVKTCSSKVSLCVHSVKCLCFFGLPQPVNVRYSISPPEQTADTPVLDVRTCLLGYTFV